MQKWDYKMMMNSFEFIHPLPAQLTYALSLLLLSSLFLSIKCQDWSFVYGFEEASSTSSRFSIYGSSWNLRKSSTFSLQAASKYFELATELQSTMEWFLSVFQSKELIGVLFCGLILVLGSKGVSLWGISSQDQAKQGILAN